MQEGSGVRVASSRQRTSKVKRLMVSLFFYAETKAQERRAQRTKGRPSGIVLVFYIKSAETSWPAAMALRI